MGFVEYIAGVLAAVGALVGLLVASDQLTQGARDRRLEMFIREASRQDPSPILASVRRTLVARAVARDAVPMSRCILPIAFLLTVWTLIGIGFAQLDQIENVDVGFAALAGLTTAGPFMMLGLWRHERARTIEALERGDAALRIYTGSVAMQSVTFRGVGQLASVGPIASAIIMLWSAALAGHIDQPWILLTVPLGIAFIVLLAKYFAASRIGSYDEPKLHAKLTPTWEHPRPGSSDRIEQALDQDANSQS